MSQGLTPFAETEALLAVLDQDDERLGELLADMLPNELRNFRDQLLELEARVSNELDAR